MTSGTRARQGGRGDGPSPGDAGSRVRVAGDCALYVDGTRQPGSLALADASATARERGGFAWADLVHPTAEEFAEVARAFGLPSLPVEDAVKAHQRPKIEQHDDVVFVVLKPVQYVDHDEVVDIAELAFFVGSDFVVTVQHGDSDVLTRVRRELDSGVPHPVPCTPSGVLYRAADIVADDYGTAIEGINDDVDDIETQVFSVHDTDHSERIYKLKREVAEFRRAVSPLAVALRELADARVPGIDPATAPYFRDVLDHVQRVGDAIDEHDRLLSDILQADLARATARHSQIALRQNEIAVRQNEDMRKISAWAAIALVPTAIAGIYGMNFEHMPELEWTYGYYIVIGIIVTTCLVLHRLFRRNGWL